MKHFDNIFIYCFLSFLYLPSIFWFFIEPNLQKEDIDSISKEQFPILNSLTVKEFPKEFDYWYSGHLPFRNKSIELYALMQYKILRNIETSKVVFGTDDWLFYCDKNDGDPIADYKRINQFTPNELNIISDKLSLFKNYSKSHNAKFVFVICPNKENVCLEDNMPFILRAKSISRTQQLIKYLKYNTDINVVYPIEELKQAKEKYPIYYKIDTHWNYVGGYIGTREVLSSLGVMAPDVSEFNIMPLEKNMFDLPNVLGNPSLFVESNAFKVSDFNEVKSLPAGIEENRFHCDKKNLPFKKIVMSRDSFGEAMMLPLAVNSEDTFVVVRKYFKYDMIEKENADLFILEICERYLYKILEDDFLK